MEKKLLFGRMADILVELLCVSREDVTPDASFINDFGIDSLGILHLIMEFEVEFGIKIPDEEIGKIMTAGDLFDAIVLAKQCASAMAAYVLMLPHLYA